MMVWPAPNKMVIFAWASISLGWLVAGVGCILFVSNVGDDTSSIQFASIFVFFASVALGCLVHFTSMELIGAVRDREGWMGRCVLVAMIVVAFALYAWIVTVMLGHAIYRNVFG